MKKLFSLGLTVTVLLSCKHPSSELASDSNHTIRTQFDEWLKKHNSADSFIDKIAEHFSPNYSILFNSESPQGPDRALFFSNSGDVILGVSPTSDDIEGVYLDRSGMVPRLTPFVYSFEDSTSSQFSYKENPESCRDCHDPNLDDDKYQFSYIWDSYARWPDTLGRLDDIAYKENYKKAKAAFSATRFKKILPEFPIPHYYRVSSGSPENKGERTIAHMPNTRLTVIMAANIGEILAAQYKDIDLFCKQEDQFHTQILADVSKLILPRKNNEVDGYFNTGVGRIRDFVYRAKLISLLKDSKLPADRTVEIEKDIEKLIEKHQNTKDYMTSSKEFNRIFSFNGVEGKNLFWKNICQDTTILKHFKSINE